MLTCMSLSFVHTIPCFRAHALSSVISYRSGGGVVFVYIYIVRSGQVIKITILMQVAVAGSQTSVGQSAASFLRCAPSESGITRAVAPNTPGKNPRVDAQATGKFEVRLRLEDGTECSLGISIK